MLLIANFYECGASNLKQKLKENLSSWHFWAIDRKWQWTLIIIAWQVSGLPQN